METSKKDWKLYTEKIAGWQESYMEKLVKEYVEYLSGDAAASEKFREIEKRIKRDKKSPGVYIELSKDDMMIDIMRLMKDGVISLEDLDGFSEELRENVKSLQNGAD